jgi:phosphatidylglycerophosphate synthase
VADPLADRVMIGVAVILLWLEGRLPFVGMAIVLVRDVLLMVGYKVAVPRGYEFEVSFLGKLATWVLYASLFALIVRPEGTSWPLALFWIGVALAVVAAAQYLARARNARATG